MTDYQIVDEPRPGSLSHLTVDPMWPLLGYMLGSAFFSWIWYGLNSFAIGSPSKRKELGIIFSGFIGYFAWIIIFGSLKSNGLVGDHNIHYARLMLTLFTLTMTYSLYVVQHRPFEIYQHFNGKVMSGMPGLLLAIVIGGSVQKTIVTTVLRVLAS
jgi:hypothetical protein